MSSLEGLTIGGIDVNDETTWMLRRLVNNPPARRAEWLDSPDADGGVLARVPTLERMTIEAELELVDDLTMDEALDALLALTEKLDECERLTPGQAVTRTPAESTRTRLTYAQLGEITNLPIEKTGDMQGWLEARPVVVVRLECVPYWLGTLTTGATVTNTDPIQTVNVTPEGNLPAFGIIRYTDGAGVDRSHVEIGADHTDDLARSYLIDSASLLTSGLAGSATTRTGAYSANGVIRATLTSTAVVVCQTAVLDLVGEFKPKLRVWGAGSGTIKVRVDYRQGDAPWTEGVWAEVPSLGAFYELDGPWQIDADEATLGAQSVEARVVAKSTVGGDTLDVDYLILLPLSGFYGLIRAPLRVTTPLTYSVRDEFTQTAGALSGKTLPVGGTWSGAGDADDFNLLGTGYSFAQRTALSDADRWTGRYAIAGTGTFTNVTVSAYLSRSVYTSGGSGYLYRGILARYTDANNWLLYHIDESTGYSTRVFVRKRVAGTVTDLLSASAPLASGTLILIVNAAGTAQVYFSGALIGTVSDSDLATGGALATGKVGIYDADTVGVANARYYQQFAAWVPNADQAVFANRSLELQHDRVLRESSAGTTWSRPPVVRGGYALLPPGGTTRIVAKARRNDVAELPDSAISDSGTLSVDYLPRYSFPA